MPANSNFSNVLILNIAFGKAAFARMFLFPLYRKEALAVAVLLLLAGVSARADVEISGFSIDRGTTLEITGPHPGLDIQDIIDGITDASASKPYLIKLGAGEYDLDTSQIVLKPYVSIQGCGESATFITSAASTGFQELSSVITGADNSTIANLSVTNTGGSTYSIAILNSGASPHIERVTANATGISDSYGVLNMSSSSPSMTDVTAMATGGVNTSGVHNDSSNPIMRSVKTNASGGTYSNAGVVNVGASSPILIQVTSSASGGVQSFGVSNSSSTSPVMTQVTATASGGVVSYGVYNYLSSAFIQDSVLQGSTKGLSIDSASGGTRVLNSKIVGGVIDDVAAVANCQGNYDETLASVVCNDPSP